jgi:hypothetical protein
LPSLLAIASTITIVEATKDAIRPCLSRSMALEAKQGFQLSNTKSPHLAAHKKLQQEIEIHKDNREIVEGQHPTRIWKRIAKLLAKRSRSHLALYCPSVANLSTTGA